MTLESRLVAAFEAEKEIRSQIIDLTQEQAKYEREGNKWAVDAIDERIAKLQDEAQARKDAAGTLAAQKAVLSGWTRKRPVLTNSTNSGSTRTTGT